MSAVRNLNFLSLVVTALLVFPLLSQSAQAQQLATDDAEHAELRACDVEGWFGAEQWIMPACHIVRGVEVIPGIGYIDTPDGWQANYEVQIKSVFVDLADNDWGIGLVGGIGPLPTEQLTREVDRDQSLYAYIPAGVRLLNDRLTLHGNLGYGYERRVFVVHGDQSYTSTHYPVIWAARADVSIMDRFDLVGEVFGEDGGSAEFQVGFRTDIVPHRLHIKTTYVGTTESGVDDLGFLFGLSWTTPPFL